MTLPAPLLDWANAVSQASWAQDIAGSWMFPLLETIHVFSRGSS